MTVLHDACYSNTPNGSRNFFFNVSHQVRTRHAYIQVKRLP
jgi:hypothetical protein